MDVSQVATLGNQCKDFFNRAGKDLIVDVLINNAGLSMRLQFLENSHENEKYMMDVNFFGPVELTRVCISFPQLILL